MLFFGFFGEKMFNRTSYRWFHTCFPYLMNNVIHLTHTLLCFLRNRYHLSFGIILFLKQPSPIVVWEGTRRLRWRMHFDARLKYITLGTYQFWMDSSQGPISHILLKILHQLSNEKRARGCSVVV